MNSAPRERSARRAPVAGPRRPLGPAHGTRPSCSLVGLAALVALLPYAAAAADGAWQAPDDVRRAAEGFARALVGQPGAVVESIAVDDRLRLPACGAPLAAESSGPFNAGRGTVVVACAGPSAWRLYVPVRLSHAVPVVVARRAVHRNQVLSAEDLAVVERPAASLPFEYFTALADVQGTTLRRSMPEGAVLVPAAVDRPSVVERGARVTLVAARGGVEVSAEGVALNRAAFGERVRVQTAAGRVVEGRAEAPDRVRVGSGSAAAPTRG